ncbi:MAG: hypothetical protein ACJ780_25710 [Solirubrobacteraceae bacterium]
MWRRFSTGFIVIATAAAIVPLRIGKWIPTSGAEALTVAVGGRKTAWLFTILATGWSLLATVSLLWPGILTARPDTALPAGFAGDRGGFELLVIAPIAVMLVLYAALYASHWTQAAPSPGEAAPEVPGAAALLTVDPSHIEH